MYYDGANLNAVCGISRPGDMGFDIVHFNLHKTFSQPHGGAVPEAGRSRSGSGSSRSCRCRRSCATTRRSGSTSTVPDDRQGARVLWAVRGLRPLAYIRSYAWAARDVGGGGPERQLPPARLKDAYELPFDRLCMHEFVLSARKLKREHGVTALDVAKRLMDSDFHPPTIYFPLNVPEALMIEPTETEPKETLDDFVEAMLEIVRDARRAARGDQGGAARTAGGRVDEVKAASVRSFATSSRTTPISRRSPPKLGNSKRRRALERTE